jgi:flagella basal body P-ring formation protein FlgA
MMNGRPINMRKTVQFMVLLTILAWATQTLFHQWGYGNDLSAQQRSRAEEPAPAKRAEKFVPGTARFAAGATLEMRMEATVVGAEVRLRQVCRWSDRDATVFAPIADLVLARVTEDAPFQAVTLQQVRRTLHDAGVNLGMVRFSGPTSCTITRGDVEYDEQEGLLEWAKAKQAPAQNDDAAFTASEHTNAPIAAAQRVEDGSAEPVAEDAAQKTLRDLLIHDLSVRLRVPQDDLHVTFNPKDDAALRLAEPQFQFDIQPKRVRNLGGVAWEVQIVTDAGGGAARKSQKMAVAATARAWQRQVVLTKPLAFKQMIRDADVNERRVLVDTLDEDPLLAKQQVVGQQAAREFKAGTVMTAKTVQSVPLARAGQFVTVMLSRGGVSIKTVGRAMGEGSFGQTIKVKNESTKDVYEVVLTGPQEGTMGPAEPDNTTVTAAE